MGGENLKGASPARRRSLGFYHPPYSSPPPSRAALAPGSHRGRDFSRTLGSAPYPPLAFLSPFPLPSHRRGWCWPGQSPASRVCLGWGGLGWGGGGVGAQGAGSVAAESQPLPEAA